MTDIQERTIAVNAIANEAQTNVDARDVTCISKQPTVYAMQKEKTTILCSIAYDGSTTIKVVKWNEK